MFRFPFGKSITPRQPSSSTSRPVFVLGAYPSAVHVEWHPPPPYQRVTAIAVDNEPTPFWDGSDQSEVVARWKEDVGFREEWGRVHANTRFNGPCGQKLVGNILRPLGADSDDVCVTDCLDTYRSSVGGSKRITDTYNPWARSVALPIAEVAPHPDEVTIVREALNAHRERLLRELDAARPELVVTLGNAALRVLRGLTDTRSELQKLSVEGYGVEQLVHVGTRAVRWLPLAHPAAPVAYAKAHARWIVARQV